MKRQIAVLACGLWFSATPYLAAQATPASPARPHEPQSEPRRAPEAVKPMLVPNVAAPPNIDPSAGGQAVNIRLDLSLVDQIGPAVSPPKTVMLLLADRSMSQVRSYFQDRVVNIDARPIITDGKIRLNFTAAIDPLKAMPSPQSDTTVTARHSLTTILENGKPLSILEMFDPQSGRKTSIEIKATILK